MPVLTIQIEKGRTPGEKAELAQSLTDAVVATLKVNPQHVTILIDEYDRENWATGGQLHAKLFGFDEGNWEEVDQSA